MPNTRIMLWVALALMGFYNYQAWMHDYPAVPSNGATAAAPASSLGDTVPEASQAASSPASSGAESAPAVREVPAAPGPDNAAAPSAGASLVHVRTDVLDVTITLKGGELDQADLPAYPQRKDTPNTPVRLLASAPPESLYLLQTGLIASDGKDAPTHLAAWSSPKDSYSLDAGAAELRVPLTWQDAQGLKVTKTFVFKRGLYAIDLIYDIDNGGSAARKLAPYSQILRHWEHPSRSYFNVETYSFKGPAVYDGSKSRDLNVESAEDGKFQQLITNGWMASLQHQFVAAVVPPADQPYRYVLQVRDNRYLLSATGPASDVAPGAKAELREKLFVGPKLQSQLSSTAPHLERTVDFGILTILAQPLFSGLNWVHGLVGNWGWAIIIVTA
ncbi:MAG: membrane protein insertase YidC, partial [Rhizobacter sp.]|nr:membrane protein insertase YidC [Rhizobacter sp.]